MLISDLIAKRILELLEGSEDGITEIQRNTFAEAIGCVPSQINYVLTSRFTPDAKRVLETMGDKLVGYDGNDVYEAAKECAFGLVKKNGEWTLDERLLSGTKAFFNML